MVIKSKDYILPTGRLQLHLVTDLVGHSYMTELGPEVKRNLEVLINQALDNITKELEENGN